MELFTKPDLYLPNKLDGLTRFNSRQEKDALLVDDDKPLSDIVKVLTDVTPLNETEAGIILLQLRANSVTDLVEYIVTCSECNAMSDFNISISEFINLKSEFYIHTEEGEFLLPIGVFESASEVINSLYLDVCSIKTIKHIEQVIEEQNKFILNNVTRECKKCSNKIEFELDPRENFSKSTTSSIYQDYVDITLHTNNGFNDIDNLYPFEREIVISLVEKHQKELMS